MSNIEGPWKMEEQFSATLTVGSRKFRKGVPIRGARGTTIAVVNLDGWDVGPYRANARLIEKAPELKDKLAEVRAHLVDQFGESEGTAEIDALLDYVEGEKQ